jgi:hypothetical protein
MDSQKVSALTRDNSAGFDYERVIDDICELNWINLPQEDLISVAWAYYHFSIQFRECLETARKLYPDDDRLLQLDHGERDTDNLSPWPGVAAAGERMNHDEFMRRTLELRTIPEGRRRALAAIGQAYLSKARAMDRNTRAMALASYEDGGLETEHIRFDSDPEQGHGALCRHLTPDDRILPLWAAFKQMLIEAVPQLAHSYRASAAASIT